MLMVAGVVRCNVVAQTGLVAPGDATYGTFKIAYQPAMDSQKLCTTCGICCDGTLYTHVTLHEEDDVIALQRAGLPIITQDSQQKFLQPCLAHQNRCCSIYSQRPHTCQQYQCKLLKQYVAHETSFENAFQIIASTLRLCDELKTAVQTSAPEFEAHSLHAFLQDFEAALSKEGQSKKERYAKYGTIYLKYGALQVLLHRHFRHETAEKKDQ